MYKHLPIYLFFLIVFAACNDKMVCAAFQSSYILDEEEQKKRFSFFEGDSLVLTASASTGHYKTNIYGISEKKYGYWKEEGLLRIKQKEVYSKEVDSLLNNRNQVVADSAESGDVKMNSPFTPQLDSAQIAQGADPWDNTKRFKYNVDFVNYMLLVGNDILKQQAIERDSAQARAARNEKLEQPSDSTSQDNKKGFLKNIFKSKAKSDNSPQEDSEAQQSEINN
jgi:hypothetical protein